MDGFIREIPIKMDDLGVPLVQDPPIINYELLTKGLKRNDNEENRY